MLNCYRNTWNIEQVFNDAQGQSSRTLEWFSRFWDGREIVEHDAYTGRPHSMCTPETTEKIRELVTSDCRLTIPVIAYELHISNEVIRQILTQDLGKRKVYSRFILHCLLEEQKQFRIHSCAELLDNGGAYSAFLDLIVTEMSLGAIDMIPKANDRAQNVSLQAHQDRKKINSKSLKSK